MVPFQLCRDSVDTGPGPFVLDGSEMPLRAPTDSATDIHLRTPESSLHSQIVIPKASIPCRILIPSLVGLLSWSGSHPLCSDSRAIPLCC